MQHWLTERRRKALSALHRKKEREARGELLVEGVRSVEAAIEGGAPVVEVLLSEPAAAHPRVRAFLDRTDAPVHVVPERDLARVSDVQTSQGVVAVVRTTWGRPERLATLPRVLVLDGVQDPGNTGTILRTAAWFGVRGVLAGPGTADFFNPKVVRAAMGGLWGLMLAQTTDLPGALAVLAGAGFAVYGADLTGTPVGAWRPRDRSVLVLGSEAHGPGPDVQACLTERVTIPGPGGTAESLNVAVAAGILLHYLAERGRHVP